MKNAYRIIGLLNVFIFFYSFSFAQINESDSVKYHLNIGLTGMYQKGNVNIFSLRGRGIFSSWLDKNVVFKTQNTWLYQDIFQKKADNNFESRNFLYYKPNQTFYPVGLGFLSNNFRRKIKGRYLFGIGETWNPIHKPAQSFKLTLSVFREISIYDESTFNDNTFDGENKIQLWRWGLYAAGSHAIWENKVNLHYHAFFQPLFENIKNYRTEVELGMDILVTAKFSFRLNYLFLSEYLVNNGINETDNILTFGIVFNAHSDK